MMAHSAQRALINYLVKRFTRLICIVDSGALAAVPVKGPLILVTNHVNFLEVPILYTHLQPRPLTGFAKSETWDNRIMGYLFNLWGAIPIRRGTADIGALKRGLAVLQAGGILAVAPEGTRSGDGRLRTGYPGVVYLAMRSQAPLLPLGCHGGEDFWQNLRRLRRTPFNITVGRAFSLQVEPHHNSRQGRQELLDQIMYQLAATLPPAYRGVYADLERGSESQLRFFTTTERNPYQPLTQDIAATT
jgi:1-acyl-sn-glycerol-3-phosphate acyltransferase